MKHIKILLFTLVSILILVSILCVPAMATSSEEEGACTEHNFSETWSSDEANHWHECECGEKADEAEHTTEGGSAATCTTQAVCGVCQASYGETLSHEYGEDGNCTHCGAAQEDVTPDDTNPDDTNPDDTTPDNTPDEPSEEEEKSEEDDGPVRIIKWNFKNAYQMEPKNIVEAVIVLVLASIELLIKLGEYIYQLTLFIM